MQYSENDKSSFPKQIIALHAGEDKSLDTFFGMYRYFDIFPCRPKKFWMIKRQKTTENHKLACIISKVDICIPLQRLGYINMTRQDLQEGSVMPPQAAAIIMYSNRTIKHVNRANSLAFFIQRARRRRFDCFLK